jgi:hypothetical protein
MHLTLLVSDAFLPEEIATGLAAPQLPGLETLIARSSWQRAEERFLEEWLLHTWGVQGFPVAPLTLLADGITPAAETWMRADPVHLRIERDHIQLFDHHAFKLEQSEADDLVAALNRHFAADGIAFQAPHPTRWYTRIRAAEKPDTTPLWRAAHRSVFERLPLSKGEVNWKSVANEIQMLLFEHPVNLAREARGEPAISGVWFWGAGELPENRGAPYGQVFSKLPLARGLALNGGIAAAPLAQDFAALGDNLEDGALVVLHQLTRCVRANDYAAWPTALAALEHDWFAPALAAMMEGRLSGVRVCLPAERVTLDCTVKRSDLHKFWRTRRPLHYYASHA